MFDGEGDQARFNKTSLNSINVGDTVPNANKDVDLLDLNNEHEVDDLKADNDYLFNLNNSKINKVTTDLPLYSFDLYTSNENQNYYKSIKVLLETGASANYINPALVNSATMEIIPLHSKHEVETANGQVSVIKNKVEFSVLANGIGQKIQAYSDPQNCFNVLKI